MGPIPAYPPSDGSPEDPDDSRKRSFVRVAFLFSLIKSKEKVLLPFA